MEQRKLLNIEEMKRLSADETEKKRMRVYRILRRTLNFKKMFEKQLFWLGYIDSFDEILKNPDYGHRVEKALYAYFICDKKRLKHLWKLSYEYEDMLYILNNLYLYVYLLMCNEEWNKDNYSPYVTIRLNMLFNKSVRLLEYIGNNDERVIEYFNKQMSLTDDFEIRVRNFNKKYIKDGLAPISKHFRKIYYMEG